MLSVSACQQIFWIVYLLSDARPFLHSSQKHCPFHLKEEEENALFWSVVMIAYLLKKREEKKEMSKRRSDNE